MSQIFVDAHVHIHPGIRPERALAAACRNFAAAAQETGEDDAPCFLLLTESAGRRVFADLKARVEGGDADCAAGFRCERTPEPETLQCREDGTERALYLVAGRQIVTAERLEVLALGFAEDFPDGRPTREVLDQLAASPAGLAVLPWGAGKWLGRRGRTVADLVREARPGALFLGDNGNRPFFWPLPTLFSEAEARGIRNLPGSDPLPFPGEERKVGAFGLRLPGSVDPTRPFASLRTLLLEAATQLVPYGRPEGLLSFFRNQAAMQLCKHLPLPGHMP